MARAGRALTMAMAVAMVVGLATAGGADAAPGSQTFKAKVKTDTASRAAGQVTWQKGQWATVYSHPESPCEQEGAREPGKPCEAEKDEEYVSNDVPTKASPLGKMKVSPALVATKAKARATTVLWGTGKVGAQTGGAPADTGIAAKGDVILYTDNSPNISASLDGGRTWAWSRNSASVFPDVPDGGVCCDQILQYVPSIDRFIWLMQTFGAGSANTNRYRIGVIPPTSVTANGITGPWMYFDLTRAFFATAGNFWDYPEMSFGSKYLYIGFHDFTLAPGFTNGTSGSVIARIGLANLRDLANINAGATPAMWWNNAQTSIAASTPTQNSGTGAYWMRVKDSATLQVYSWPENSTAVTMGELTVPQFPTDWSQMPTPPGGGRPSTALFEYRNYTYGAARDGDRLYFAWSAPAGGATWPQLTQAAAVNVTINGANSGNLVLGSLGQWWSPSLAMGIPNLAVSNGHLGVALGVMQASTSVSNTVIFDETARSGLASISQGTLPPTGNRWGDYQAIRPWFGKNMKNASPFVASGYGREPVNGRPTSIATWGWMAAN